MSYWFDINQKMFPLLHKFSNELKQSKGEWTWTGNSSFQTLKHRFFLLVLSFSVDKQLLPFIKEKINVHFYDHRLFG